MAKSSVHPIIPRTIDKKVIPFLMIPAEIMQTRISARAKIGYGVALYVADTLGGQKHVWSWTGDLGVLYNRHASRNIRNQCLKTDPPLIARVDDGWLLNVLPGNDWYKLPVGLARHGMSDVAKVVWAVLARHASRERRVRRSISWIGNRISIISSN